MVSIPPRGSARLAFSVVLALGMTVVLAALVSSMADDNDSAIDDGQVSWLYSHSAESAELDDLGDGAYRLIMRDVDPHMIQFSDRPDRLVEVIDVARFVHNWDVLFESSAPNAVLIEHEPTGETDSLVVVLSHPVYDTTTAQLSYDVELLADEFHPERLTALVNHHARPPVTMRSVSLFIDSVEDVPNSSAVDLSTLDGPAAQALADQIGEVGLGGGVQLVSADVSLSSDGTITGTAVIDFDNAGFELDATIDFTDADNWSLSIATPEAEPWTPVNLPSLTIDPTSFTGTISMADGSVSYSITGGTHMWAMSNGSRFVSTLEFSTDCPLDESMCPSGTDGPYLSMTGDLEMVGLANQISMVGAVTTDGAWARFHGSAGDITAGNYEISNTSLDIWHGQRSDSYDPNMDLPSLATLNNGMDLEFCGGFTLPIPGRPNAASDGCARWSPQGVVLGQVGVDSTVSGTVSAAGVDDATATATVKGLAWTNLDPAILASLPSSDVLMSGVHDALESQTVTLSGQASLPGFVANALNIDLRGADSLVFDVNGSISLTGFSLTATLPTKIHIGSEPFQTDITSITATITAGKQTGASINIGTVGAATIGYSPNTRPISTSVELVAATSPSVGVALSVSATGTAAPGDTGGNGLTVAQRLSDPAHATYVWPNQFGIGGMNLWSFTAQIAYEDGSPSLAYSSTTYLDPTGSTTGSVIVCDGPCGSDDWMVGTLGLDVSYTTPCLAYSFGSGSGTSGLGIDGGTIEVSSFAIGIAPDGCTIQTGSTTQSLPVGFAGFQFEAKFGSASLDVATELSTDGFVFDASLGNLTLAGITYDEVDLSITINDDGSDLSFTSVLDSGMGDMTIISDFETNTSGTTQSIDATLVDWAWGSDQVDIESLHFSESATIPTTASGCASFDAEIDGSITIEGSTLEFIGAETAEADAAGSSISIDCDGLQSLYLNVVYTHTSNDGSELEETLIMQYPDTINGSDYFYGETDFSYKKHFSKKYSNKTFSKNVTISIGMSVTVNPDDPASSGFGFWGGFDADRVSGSLDCELPAGSADFSCAGKLRLNPSWAGVYHHNWDSL